MKKRKRKNQKTRTKIFTEHIFIKDIYSEYTELSKLNNKQINNPIFIKGL